MKKKKIIIAVTALLTAAGAAGATGFYLYHQKGTLPEAPRLPEGISFSEDVVSATGVTSVGMREEAYELGFLADGLYVEEAFLNIGDEVEAHTPVFQVSEDSLSAARRELEKKVKEAGLNRRQGEITFKTGMVDAQKNLDLAETSVTYAQTVYDNAVKSAQNEVDSLQEQVDDAQEKVDEYTASIEEDYYYTCYKVGELEAAWKDNAAFLLELYENWDVDSLESIYGGSRGKNGIGYVTNQVSKSPSGSASENSGATTENAQQSGGASPNSGSVPSGVSFSQDQAVTVAESESGGVQEEESAQEGGTDSQENESASENPEGQPEEGNRLEGEKPSGGFPGGGAGDEPDGDTMRAKGDVNVGDNEIKYNIYLAMEEEADESKDAYETALESYQDAKAKAAAGIEQAKSELAVLMAKLEEQKITFEQAQIDAKKEYDLAVSEQENAQMVYDSAVKQLQEDLETLKDAEETAAENLALFEESIGDGTFYTGAQGTVVMNNVRSNSRLTEDTVILAYSNPETVSVAASVDQADIASISIGEEACVVISGYGSFNGKVTSLSPVSSSGGGSSVSYTVNVVLEGDISTLESNLTANVYFGLTQEEKEMLEGTQKSGMPEGFSENMPDALPDGEMPQRDGGNGFSDNRPGREGGGSE